MKKLYDLDVSEVSLVPRGANKKKFLIFKSAAEAKVLNWVTSISPEAIKKLDRALDGVKVAKAKLTTQGREDIKPSNFVFPKDKRYPIHDLAHARNALARSSGKPEEAKVRAAVYRKYPQLKKSVSKDDSALSDRAKLALRASARILAPHKDEISTDHLKIVGHAIGIQDTPEDEGMPLEGSAGRQTPLESDERADDSLDMETGAVPTENTDASKEMEDHLKKAFSIHVKDDDKEEELSGETQKVEGDSGEDAEEASGLEKEDDMSDDEEDTKHHHEEDDEDEEDEEDGDEEDVEMSDSMSPEQVSAAKAMAHKAGMAAYKSAVDAHVKKLGRRMYPDEKELMKSKKDGKPVEEEEVGKTSVSKSDSLDLTAVPEKVRPAVESIFKSQKELVKKNQELQSKVEEMEKTAKRKEFVAKAATFKHYTGDKNALVEQLLELDAVNPKLRETVEKQLETLDAEKENVAKGLFNEIGSSLPSQGNNAEAKIDSAVNSIVAKSSGRTKEQVYEEYLRTSEGQALYREMKNSRPGGI